MDPITHAALGASCAQLALNNKDKRNPWLVGGLAAMAPDLDVFIHSSTDPMLALLYHRHFTHSLLFIPLGALLVTLGLMLFQRFRSHWQLTFVAALIGYASHGILDALTSYGTLLYWPFSMNRVSWDLVAIIDPFVTIPLIVGLIWTWANNNRLGVILGLSFVTLFLLFNTFQHYRALNTAKAYGRQQQLQIHDLRALPDLASSTRWRIVSKLANKHLFVGQVNTPLFGDSTLYGPAQLPFFDSQNLPTDIKASPSLLRDFTIFNWFTDGYLILAQANPLILADGRYLTGYRPLFSFWAVEFIPSQTHVNKLHFLQVEPLQ